MIYHISVLTLFICQIITVISYINKRNENIRLKRRLREIDATKKAQIPKNLHCGK